MTVISLAKHRSIDPHKDYYNLPLEKRTEEYYRWIWERAYDLRTEVLDSFHPQSQLISEISIDGLTQELRKIIPSFNGEVLARCCEGNGMTYVVEKKWMEKLFGESIFGNISGKVVTASDDILAPQYKYLAGYIVLLEKQKSDEKLGFIAAHEGYHSGFCQYPNALRRDAALQKLTKGTTSLEERARCLLDLNRSILLDETGACLESFRWLSHKLHNPSYKRLTGRCSSYYDPTILQKMNEPFESLFMEEVKNSSRSFVGFHLDQIRKSKVNQKLNTEINKHEQESLLIPSLICCSVNNLSRKLLNPENLSARGYAMSYVCEALQILDVEDIILEKLEPFCLKVMEPHRLGRMGDMRSAFFQVFADTLKR